MRVPSLGTRIFFGNMNSQKVGFFGIRCSQPAICLDRQQERRGCTEGSFYLLFFLKVEIGVYKYGEMPSQRYRVRVLSLPKRSVGRCEGRGFFIVPIFLLRGREQLDVLLDLRLVLFWAWSLSVNSFRFLSKVISWYLDL